MNKNQVNVTAHTNHDIPIAFKEPIDTHIITKSTSSALADATAAIMEMRRQIDTQQAQYNEKLTQSSVNVKELTAKVTILEEQSVIVKASLKDAQAKEIDLVAQNRALSHELSQQKAHLTAMERTAAERLDELSSAGHKISKAMAGLEVAQRELQESNQTIKHLKSELSRRNEVEKGLQRQIEDAQTWKNAVLEKHSAVTTGTASIMHAIQGQLQDLNSCLNNLTRPVPDVTHTEATVSAHPILASNAVNGRPS